MILSYEKPTVISKCDNCGIIKETTIKGVFEEDENSAMGHYKNLYVPCECGTTAVFNTNIDVFQFDYEDVEELNIPDKELNQRHYLTKIIKDFRGDYVVHADGETDS